MQDYILLAAKNGVILLGSGDCQFCGAKVSRGVHECLEIFNPGFQTIDFSDQDNVIYRFLIVDAHTLQHPEIHGRWNNHFHLTRLHLIFSYQVKWTYDLSPQLSDHLNRYKAKYPEAYLEPPAIGQRGTVTASDVREVANDSNLCRAMIENWAKTVYAAWSVHHATLDPIANSFVNRGT